MAEQTARNWSSGDIVTAANLKSIERGVSAMSEEYTPTTWTNGNTVTAAGLNNIEQGIVNGSLSDFSTAEVTLAGDNAEICLPFCLEQGDMTALFNVRQTYSPGTYEIALWKGASLIEIYNEATVETSGNIEDFDEGMYLITGDCTITISGESSGDVIVV